LFGDGSCYFLDRLLLVEQPSDPRKNTNGHEAIIKDLLPAERGYAVTTSNLEDVFLSLVAMRNPFHTQFAAVFANEVLFNSKRAAPYVLMLLFIVNAVMWSVSGAAVVQGWATNSDYNIARNFLGFSWILGLPIFTAVIMGDPVLRDFRLGVNSLIFSKPISRTSYLLGKFFGNFFVLVCCMAFYALTLLVMQVVHTSSMIVLPVRVLPYFKHFFFFTVISHLLLAAIYFSVGALRRSAKMIYGFALSFYPLYIVISLTLKGLPMRWRLALDPFLFMWVDLLRFPPGAPTRSAAWIDQYVVTYDSDMMANRGFMVLGAVVCLTILCFRFKIAERPERAETSSVLDLSTEADKVYYSSEGLPATRIDLIDNSESHERVMLPSVATASEGFRTTVKKLIAALGIEFRLLRAERSLIVLAPLAIFFSILELAFYKVVPEVSYSAVYASSTARAMLLFLLGMSVFYTGEAMHRDRELKIVPTLWAAPITNSILLLSKFLATVLLGLSLAVLVGGTAIAIQFLKGDTPVNISAYLITYCVILLPSIVFMTGASVGLNVLLRDKYVSYTVIIGISAGFFYLYGQGYKHWIYNPVLYDLWTYSDLTGAGLGRILIHRVYILALAGLLLAIAHLSFERKSTKGLWLNGRLASSGWALLLTAVSLGIAVAGGISISR
jgi:ABC-2 type transport system permease protein